MLLQPQFNRKNKTTKLQTQFKMLVHCAWLSIIVVTAHHFVTCQVINCLCVLWYVDYTILVFIANVRVHFKSLVIFIHCDG